MTALDTPPVLREDLPAPTPEADEVLVRVHASSANPADNGIATGMLKPDGIDLATAGIAPVAGIAAMLAVDDLDPSEADSVLIVGATGGVGSVAVQLAARVGATVVAPAFPDDE